MLAAITFGEQQIIDPLDAIGPAALGSADIDQDGDFDLIVASQLDGNLSWYENTNGIFDKRLIDTIDESGDVIRIREVAVADFDGDNDQDVAVAVYGNDQIQWYRNLGGGEFDSAEIITTRTDAVRSIAAADLDGDGDIDLVSGSWIDDKVAWYVNDGQGNFTGERLISLDTDGPRSVRVGDINGDNRPDIIVASRMDDTISWFPNQGGGNFGAQQKLTTSNNGPEALALGDADGDGDLDLFMASYWDATIAWFENVDGQGNFGPQQDLSTTANRGQFVALGDLDGDGDQDVLAASYYFEESKTTWFENLDGSGNFSGEKLISDELNGAEAITVVDVDGDNSLDVVVASLFDNRVSWFRNDGQASFSVPHQVLSDASGSASVSPADFDGDGDLDLLVASNNDDEVSWYENLNGNGVFSKERVISQRVRSVQTAIAADLDGDGDMDVVSASYEDNKIAWYENEDGAGTFGSQQVVSRQTVGAIDVHAADFDNDGDLDLVTASARDSIIAWYENEDGQGDFGRIKILTRNAISAEWVTSADLDGDNDLDILSASYGDGRVAWYENTNGQGDFASAKTLTTGEGSTAVEAGDLDGDGDLDLVVTEYGAGRIVWLEQTTPLTFGAPQLIGLGIVRVEALQLADMDGNGSLDILTASDDFVIRYERRNDGSYEGQFVTSGNVERVFELAVADIDGDGDQDLLSAAAYGTSNIAWYENQSSAGDFDGDTVVDAADIALLCAAIGQEEPDLAYDLNADSLVNHDDLSVLIEDILQTSAGDANLDGRFNSSDLVIVFREGLYENQTAGIAGWMQGDWNCDGIFSSADLVEAFKAGTYERELGAASALSDSAFRAHWAAALATLDSDKQRQRRT